MELFYIYILPIVNERASGANSVSMPSLLYSLCIIYDGTFRKQSELAPILIVLSQLTAFNKVICTQVQTSIFQFDLESPGIFWNVFQLIVNKEKTNISLQSIFTASGMQYIRPNLSTMANHSIAALHVSSAKKDALTVLPMKPQKSRSGSLQGSLISLMTSLDTTVKRCSSEFLFTLCNNDRKSLYYICEFYLVTCYHL